MSSLFLAVLDKRHACCVCTIVLCLAIVSRAAPVRAQSFETVGARAQGMGGAFVAVADDVTAVYWNPAGLVNAPLFDVSLQYAESRNPTNPASTPAEQGGWHASTVFGAFAFPSLGVSYLRTRLVQSIAPTARPIDSRQDEGPGVTSVTRLATDQVGLTLLQSLTGNLVVGTTLKLLRGSFATAPLAPGASSLSDALEQAAGTSASGVTRFDLDAGVLAWSGPLRAGFVAHNLFRPEFAQNDAVSGGRLDRQARVGVAVTPGFTGGRTPAGQPTLTISFDADLTRSLLPTGDERHLAAGVERWFLNRRVAVRGGVRANTIGDARPVATAGASVAIRPGVFVEGHVGRGRAAAGDSWSVAGRVSY